MSWLALAKTRFSQKRQNRTAKTDERGVLSVLAGLSGRVYEFPRRVSSVSSVGVTALFENCISAEELLIAAMKACDHHGDGPAAREQMRQDCLATPPELRAELLEHFTCTYGPVPQERPQPVEHTAPASSDPADWKPLHAAYMTHVQGCPTCRSAGWGYGQRCATGLSLWVTYADAVPPRAPAPNWRTR